MGNSVQSLCKTCFFWDEERRDRSVRQFDREGILRICGHPKLSDLGFVSGHSDSLAYEYDEGGLILTGPEFGCVHHEERT